MNLFVGTTLECRGGRNVCEQLCVDTWDSYYCACEEGYELVAGGTSCPYFSGGGGGISPPGGGGPDLAPPTSKCNQYESG